MITFSKTVVVCGRIATDLVIPPWKVDEDATLLSLHGLTRTGECVVNWHVNGAPTGMQQRVTSERSKVPISRGVLRSGDKLTPVVVSGEAEDMSIMAVMA